MYTIYGAAEDLIVLERFKDGTYKVPNLHIIDETTTYAIKTPSGLTIRLFGLGGSLVVHRLFDHGDASLSIAGSPGVMWTSTLQMGQLISTVRKSFVPSEIRVFVTHPSPSREGLLAQLAVALRTDFTVSSGLHFLYGSSFNEYSALPSLEHFRGILAMARSQFMDLWDAVKIPLFSLVDEVQNQQLMLAYEVFEAMPSLDNQSTSGAEGSKTGSSTSTTTPSSTQTTNTNTNTIESIEYLEVAFRNMWHFNLCDHTNGSMVLAVNGSRVSSESYSEGFNFEYRLTPQTPVNASSSLSSLPEVSVPTNSTAPAPTPRRSPVPSSAKPLRTILKNTSLSKTEKPKTSSPTITSASTATGSTTQNASTTTTTTPAPTTASAEAKPASSATRELEPPGVWIANGNAEEEDIRGYFDEEGRKTIKSVVKKGNYTNPEKMFALVYFGTPEEAAKALKNLDLEKAGARSNLIRQAHTYPTGSDPNPATNGTGRGHRSSNSMSSGGWSTAGSARGGRGSYRGRGNSSSSSFAKGGSSRIGSSKPHSTSSSFSSSTTPATSTSGAGSSSISTTSGSSKPSETS